LIISENLDDFWALNARATSKKLTVFSMKTGQMLPGAGGEKELKTPTCQQLETKVFSFFLPFVFFFSKKPCFSNFFQHFFGGFGDVLRTSAMIQGHPFVGPGCEIQLPLRFDKVCVYPGHKVWIIPWFLMMGMIFL
jgi:hypothetical protein